ncbi:MAG: HlyD family secretion protein, partial [Fluviibacter sp.]
IAKAQIKAPRAGIALFDDPSEWIGKPVAAGEKVMVVATEGDVEIEAWVPIGDAIALPKEAPVSLYLNATPLSPVDGHSRFIGHEALQRPDGSYAYRLRATLDAGETAPHVGLKGTAKISGEFVPLVYWVFRKPLGTVRQFLGI